MKRHNRLQLKLLAALPLLLVACDADVELARPLSSADSKSLSESVGVVNDTTTGDATTRTEVAAADTSSASQANAFQPARKIDRPFINSMRVWSDSNQEFSAQAELLGVAMSSRQVRLLKDNGVTITVAFDRLSDHDQNFVAEFIAAYRAETTNSLPKLVDSF